jgi:hypothetical protein
MCYALRVLTLRLSCARLKCWDLTFEVVEIGLRDHVGGEGRRV